MATDVSPADSPLSGQVLFYSNPEPLDPTRHAKLGMKNNDKPYGFAANQHFIPLHVGEFGLAGIHFPIIFAGEDRAPIAVMGIVQGENLFIGADGGYRAGAYIPSFIRRYPFVGAKDDQAQRVVICIDRDSALWTEDNPEVRLFENGEATAFTKNCVEFCSQFDADRATTEFFIKLLVDLDLLVPQQTNYTPRTADGGIGVPQVVADYFAVSIERLNALPAEKLAELRDNGALQQIYAHLMSLNGWDRMVIESLTRRTAALNAPKNA